MIRIEQLQSKKVTMRERIHHGLTMGNPTNHAPYHGQAVVPTSSVVFDCSSRCFSPEPPGQWYSPRYIRVGCLWASFAFFFDLQDVKIIIILKYGHKSYN